MKYLIEILLPLSDNDGVPFPEDFLRRIQTELTDRFGGVTAHGRAPATGIWRRGNDAQSADIVIVEVMTDKLEPDWWLVNHGPVCRAQSSLH